MKKVAITTMTGSANYGNALQNYAVLKLIENSGYIAETLNITTQNGFPDAIPDEKSLLYKLAPSYILGWFHSKISSKYGAKNDSDFRISFIKKLKANKKEWESAKFNKREIFKKFQKETLKYTDFTVNNINFNLEKLEQYSAFVTGSDQVWNPYYCTNSMVEFLQPAPKEKRIAFAPSFGVSEIPDCRKKEYSQWISEIPYLSVREKEGARIIEELTGRKAKVLLDPTFGLTKDEWLNFAVKPKNFNLKSENYVFCYFLGNRTRKYTKYINKYAKLHNCSIVDVYDVAHLEHYVYSPNEFVWLLANAKAVFTDSFHGCAFSINLQKPFVVFDRAGDGCIAQSSRITTVLDKTGLENRKFEKIPISEVDNISFEKSVLAVEKEREEMASYLTESLEKASSANCDINLIASRHCTGCGACENACKQNAITMQSDNEGFLYPIIDTSKCVKCHACENVCPADKIKTDLEDTKAFYAYSNNSEICKNSSSGGIFTELSEIVLTNGGIVFGAGYDDNFKVCHKSAENSEQLSILRTSKYVQSDTLNIYNDVLEQLKTGRQVLFSGTPCQVAALRTFLNKNYDNLITVDIICHGVPSPGMWEKYLKQEHSEKKITSVSFRNKDLGWNDFSMKINYADGSFYRELAVNDPFERAFLANLTLRPSCYQCQYKTVQRVSDITIADFWGVETIYPELKNQQGVSLVLTHNDCGLSFFNSLKNISFKETNLQTAVNMNSGCEHSVAWHKNRKLFFELESKFGIKKAAYECLKLSNKQKFKRFIIINGSRVKKVLRKVGILK